MDIVIPTNNDDISSPTSSTPLRHGPVNFSQHPDLADSSEPPITGGIDYCWMMVAREHQSLPLLFWVRHPRRPHPLTGMPLHPFPHPKGCIRITTIGGLPSLSLLLAGPIDDPSTMTLDQIFATLKVLDQLSDQRWEFMHARNSEMLTQLKTLDIKLGYHTETAGKVASGLSEVDALTARTATLASDALQVATAAREDAWALVDTLTKHNDIVLKLQAPLPPRPDTTPPSDGTPPRASAAASHHDDYGHNPDPSPYSATPTHGANFPLLVLIFAMLSGDLPPHTSSHRDPRAGRQYHSDRPTRCHNHDSDCDSHDSTDGNYRTPRSRRKDWSYRAWQYDPRHAYHGGGGGDGDDDGSGDGGDGLSPRMGPARSPRQRAALTKDLSDDILLWHAGSLSCRDPVDGIDFLEASDVEALDVDSVYLVMILEEHLELVDNWSNPCWVSHDNRHYGAGYTPSAFLGPNITDILKQVSNWDKLSDLTPTGWQAFYKKLRRYSFRWKIALIPFEVINLRYECQGHGLCLCGLGLSRWRRMGDALFLVLENLLPDTDQRVTTAIETLANGSLNANGYELLWVLMKEFIPMFDRTIPSQLPSWLASDDLYHYARLIIMYCDMSRHSGTRFTEVMKSRMFLRGVKGKYPHSQPISCTGAELLPWQRRRDQEPRRSSPQTDHHGTGG